MRLLDLAGVGFEIQVTSMQMFKLLFHSTHADVLSPSLCVFRKVKEEEEEGLTLVMCGIVNRQNQGLQTRQLNQTHN